MTEVKEWWGRKLEKRRENSLKIRKVSKSLVYPWDRWDGFGKGTLPGAGLPTAGW